MLKSYLSDLFVKAANDNRANILKFAEGTNPTFFLDLGCDDGEWTTTLAQAASAKNISGIELIEERAELARKRSINVTLADLGKTLPLNSNSYDLIHSNQVIEHVPDVDLFTEEIMRLLTPGGRVIVSTENGSSWHNIFASILGWQIFSLTNMSQKKCGIGNPMALLRNQPLTYSTWTHKVIFNYRGLIEFFESHGFVNIKIKGAGYYPLPSFFGKLDPRHSHFITICAQKPN